MPDEMVEAPLTNSEVIQEFRQALGKEVELPVQTAAVMVLSHSDPTENADRTTFSVELFKKITAKKLGIESASALTEAQILEHAPVFLVNGTPDQNEQMYQIARAAGIPREKIDFVPNPPPPHANTKTQFELIPTKFLEPGTHLTIVSGDYHDRRVTRTADKNLPQGIDFTFVGSPWLNEKNHFGLIRGEVKRIKLYSGKGDIAVRPKRG